MISKKTKILINHVILIFLFIIYILACNWGIETYGNQMGLAALFPIVAGALLYRVRGGLISAAATSAVFVFFLIIKKIQITDIPFFAVGTAVLFGVGIFTGLLQNYRRRIETERDELKKAHEKLERNEILFRTFMDNFPGLAYIDDEQMNLVAANKAHQQNFDSANKIGKSIADFLHPDVVEGIAETHKKAKKGPIETMEPYYRKDGTVETHQVFRFPINMHDGSVLVGGLSIDRTAEIKAKEELEQALKDKEVLLQEVYHRIKNNLVLIQSLIELRITQKEDTEGSEILNDLKDKILSIALVHKKLYQSASLEKVNAKEYITDLGTSYSFLEDNKGDSKAKIKISYDVEDIFLTIDRAVPIGLIITEAVTNAVKYAFTGRAAGTIVVTMKNENGKVNLTVADNGVGFSGPEQNGTENQESESLGIKLMEGLSRQIEGEFNIQSSADGTVVGLTFSAWDHEQEEHND